MPATRGRGILKERPYKGKNASLAFARAKSAVARHRRCLPPQWHSHTAVLWHEAPPLGHSSPALQEAGLSPQLTEHPPQVPRGEEGGALQEFTCAALSPPD